MQTEIIIKIIYVQVNIAYHVFNYQMLWSLNNNKKIYCFNEFSLNKKW